MDTRTDFRIGSSVLLKFKRCDKFLNMAMEKVKKGKI